MYNLLLTALLAVSLLLSCNSDTPPEMDETAVDSLAMPELDTLASRPLPARDGLRADRNEARVSDEPVPVGVASSPDRADQISPKSTLKTKPVVATKTKPAESAGPAVVLNTKPVAIPTPPKNENQPVIQEAKTVNYPNHGPWGAQLNRFVSSTGTVNYVAWEKEIAVLDAYLDSLKNQPPQSSWSRQQTLAYWLNAYNAFTVKLILDNYPLASITDLHGGKPWDVSWIEIGGRTYSLNEIEHEIIRPRFQDARIHFAVNCAASSCPPLHNAAFKAPNLDRVLDKLTRTFINNPKYNQINAEGASVSKIFDWYAEDFGNLRRYLNKYATTDLGPDAPITYREYDWSLND